MSAKLKLDPASNRSTGRVPVVTVVVVVHCCQIGPAGKTRIFGAGPDSEALRANAPPDHSSGRCRPPVLSAWLWRGPGRGRRRRPAGASSMPVSRSAVVREFRRVAARAHSDTLYAKGRLVLSDSKTATGSNGNSARARLKSYQRSATQTWISRCARPSSLCPSVSLTGNLFLAALWLHSMPLQKHHTVYSEKTIMLRAVVCLGGFSLSRFHSVLSDHSLRRTKT